jgi:hypothetical protein
MSALGALKRRELSSPAHNDRAITSHPSLELPPMSQEPIVLLRALVSRYEPSLQGAEAGAIERSLEALESALSRFSAVPLQPTQLGDEFEAMGELYRAIRAADVTMQRQLRSSDVSDRLTRLYYALRTVQASLAMAYSMAGSEIPRPETSPVQSAIGLYDAPKVLAQEKHLLSGSYDTVLPYFVRWMQEIAADLDVRRADYQHFYGEADTRDALSSVRRILGLDEQGMPRLRQFEIGGPDDPAADHDQLEKLASDPDDLAGAVQAIQEVGQHARLALISLLANRDSFRTQLGDARLAEVEQLLERTVHWPYPVGETPLYELGTEQASLDELLREVPDDTVALRDPATGWSARIWDAFRQACRVEQSIRDHPVHYRERYPDPRWRRGFRWYVWELHNLVRQASGPETLGARRR